MEKQRPLIVNTQPHLEPHERPGYRRLGSINGLLIGIALALGALGLETWRLARLPILLANGSLILTGLSMVMLCLLSGWLTSRFAKTWLTILLWLVTSVICTLLISYQPYYGRSLIVWLADRRFWGLPIYPLSESSIYGIILGGLFVILVLTVLGLLQETRLEGVQNELNEQKRLSGRSWLMLLFPLPFIFVAGWITSNTRINPAANAATVVYEAIETGRDYEGDLFELGLQRGNNYAAIRGVRDQMVGTYTLHMGEVDPASSTAFVLAQFANGSWINCRVVNDQLSFCFDAAPPYTTGLASLISGIPPADDCLNCVPKISAAWQNWLSERSPLLGENPQIERLAQWGGYVLMRAQSDTGDYAVECWFDRMSPVQIERCVEVGS